jgi:hypothetical protein
LLCVFLPQNQVVKNFLGIESFIPTYTLVRSLVITLLYPLSKAYLPSGLWDQQRALVKQLDGVLRDQWTVELAKKLDILENVSRSGGGQDRYSLVVHWCILSEGFYSYR